MPPTPDEAIAIKQWGGGPGSLRAMGAIIAERVFIRIECRATSRQDAEDKCYAVTKALDGEGNILLSGVRYLSIDVSRAPGPKLDGAGVDQSANRFTWYSEFRVLKAQS